MPAPTAAPVPAPRVGSATDSRRKAHAKLTERVDPNRSRHKPLSILRAEARRAVEAFLDAEALVPHAQREAFVEDILAESVGFGPLEELFRDDAVREILVLAPHMVLALRNADWTPTSARFRDLDQWRGVVARWGDAAEALVPEFPTARAFDVRLANGFRAVGVIPPLVMELSPQVSLTRGAATPQPQPGSGPVRPFPNMGSGGQSRSGTIARPPVRSVQPPSTITIAPPVHTPVPEVPLVPAAPDSHAKLRQRVAERIVLKFAAAGVYDLNQIPLVELRRIVAAHVSEFCQQERIGLDDSAVDRLAIEILAGMNR